MEPPPPLQGILNLPLHSAQLVFMPFFTSYLQESMVLQLNKGIHISILKEPYLKLRPQSRCYRMVKATFRGSFNLVSRTSPSYSKRERGSGKI